MAKSTDEIRQEVTDLFDREVTDLGQEDYQELLDNLTADFQSRLDCVNEELADEQV